MRYRNSVFTENRDLEAEGSAEEDFAYWIGPDGEPMTTPPNVFLPAFTRPVAAMHLDASQTSGDARAGYADGVLVWGTARECCRLIAEAKPFWAFTNKFMHALVSGLTAEPGTGIFKWERNDDDVGKPVCLNALKQVRQSSMQMAG